MKWICLILIILFSCTNKTFKKINYYNDSNNKIIKHYNEYNILIKEEIFDINNQLLTINEYDYNIKKIKKFYSNQKLKSEKKYRLIRIKNKKNNEYEEYLKTHDLIDLKGRMVRGEPNPIDPTYCGIGHTYYRPDTRDLGRVKVSLIERGNWKFEWEDVRWMNQWWFWLQINHTPMIIRDSRIFLSLGKNIDKEKKISRENFLKILRNLSEHYVSSKDSLILKDQEIDQTVKNIISKI